MVGLKYCSATMRCDRVVDGEGGASASPAELICSLGELSQEISAAPAGEGAVEADSGAKRSGGRPKGNISWVSAQEAVRAEVRLYSHLFTVDSPDDRWEEQVCVCVCVSYSVCFVCASTTAFFYEQYPTININNQAGIEKYQVLGHLQPR